MKIKVKVITKSSENKVEYDKEYDLYKVKVTVIPEKGKANNEVTKLLAGHFNVNKKSVQIVSGTTSGIKIFEITNS